MSDQPQTRNGPDLTAGIPANSLAEGVPLLGYVQDEPVILVRRGAEVFAIGATCSHYGGPLADGLVVDDTVRCPWHHACFSLRTGEALGAPALSPVAGYELVQRAGQVFVTGKRAKPGSVRRLARPGTATPRSVAIVGAGAAGNSAADELRHLGFDGDITLIDRDQEAPYDRPNLSKDYLAGSVQEEQLPLHPRAYYEGRRVELVRGRQVTALDLDRKCLTFDDGTTREFGAIVLATGADPVRLAMPGEPGPPVHYLRTLTDSRAIIKSAEGARRAVVLGASFIGLEVAASLRARKIEVHVVAPGRRPLERVLGPELGDFIRGLHEQHGVVFHLGGKASGLTRGGVVLEGGEQLDADFIVAGIGVRPATALAEQAGLRVEKGIVVDAYLETATQGSLCGRRRRALARPAQRRPRTDRALGVGPAAGPGRRPHHRRRPHALHRRAILLESALRHLYQLRRPCRALGDHRDRRQPRAARRERALSGGGSGSCGGEHLSRSGEPRGGAGDGTRDWSRS